MTGVKDMGWQMGYRSLEWNWPKDAMNILFWAGIVHFRVICFPFSTPFYRSRLGLEKCPNPKKCIADRRLG